MKKRILSMVLALSMMLTFFPVSVFADTGKATPPDDAYQVYYFYSPATNPVKTWAFSSMRDYQSIRFTDFEARKRNSGDSNNYGKASVHFYQENAAHNGPDYSKEVDPNATLPPLGVTYYAVAYTAGNDQYEEKVYESSAVKFSFDKFTPVANPSLYTPKLNGESLNGKQEIPANSLTTATVTVDKTDNTTGDASNLRYAPVTSYGAVDLAAATDDLSSLTVGTYQVYFDMAESDYYYSSPDLTYYTWRFTVIKPVITPDLFTFNSKTGTFDKLPDDVTKDDVTIEFYDKNNKLVDDFVQNEDGVSVPRLAGTYSVGVKVKKTLTYDAYDSNGPVAGWTYEKAKNIPTSADFTVISAPEAENAYTGKPVTKAKVEAHDNIMPVTFSISYYNKATKKSSDTAPKDAGSYSWYIDVKGDDNTTATQIYPLNSDFTITAKASLTTDEITVTVPNVTEGDDADYNVTFASKDESLLATDDLEITYYDADGNLLTEVPTKAGTYTYHITVKAGSAAEQNFGEGAFLSGTYTIYSTEPTVTGGELKPTDPDTKLAPGVDVTLTAEPDTETSVFQQWVITVDGVEVQPTKEDLKAKLGVDVEDDDAAVKWMKTSPVSFKLPAGKLNISTLTSNPQQETFDKAAGTALIVTGAAAATGAVYYFGTTAYIRSVLPEGVAVPQNREQLAVALWTLAGKPATESTTVFTDVPADSEALPAIRWAVETGVLNAKTTEDGTSFLAGNYVTRAETAIRLFKLQKQLAE